MDVGVLRRELDGVLDVCGTKTTHRDVALEELSNQESSTSSGTSSEEEVVVTIDDEGNVSVQDRTAAPSATVMMSMFPEVVQVRVSLKPNNEYICMEKN